MKVSIVITVFNEEKTISKLLNSLVVQSKKPNEIIVIDAGSTDKTLKIIRHFQKKDRRIKVLIEKCSRSKGRNLGVEISKNELIAMTDAGCIADKNWLKNIIEPFKYKNVGIVAGFYEMVGSKPFQKALSVFLGVTPSKFDVMFLPSTRSVAFRREVWEKIGGFPENLDDTAEDTIFNYKALREGVKFARVKNAIVEWGMPTRFSEGIRKMFLYAKGDAKSMIWNYPSKNITSHNIKVLFILFRYIVGFCLIYLAFSNPLLWPVVGFGLFLYSIWAFRKVYMISNDIEAGLWGILTQYLSDFVVMLGFGVGLLSRK